MFERYTEKARRAIFFARYEASQYGSTTIETEHLLLGIFREDHALTRKFLSQKGGAQALRDEIESHIARGARISTSVEVPLTPECKRILNRAAEEAELLGSKHVGNEHMLLGIFHEPACFAARLLADRGLTLSSLREELARHPVDSPVKTVNEIVSVRQVVHAWSYGLASDFAGMFASNGQFVDPRGDLSIGPAAIQQAASLIFAAQAWTKTQGEIEDVQFVGNKAMMITLAWEPAEKLEKPNPACVRMTVILIQKPEGWIISRVQATGIQPQSRAASV
jgi:uncharacterized protein (TIGR02246 family)